MKKLFVLAATCCIAVSVFAQETKSIEGQNRSVEIQSIQTAAALAQYGYQNDSPTALIEAARIFGTTQTQAGDCEGVSEVPQSEGAAKESGISYDPQQLLADAKEMAGNDPEINALIKRTEQEIKEFARATKGVVGGAEIIFGRVDSRSYNLYTFRFWGNELAEVGVVGDGDTDLDLYIYDQNGDLVVRDINYGDTCYCAWVPSRTSVYIVKVVNHGNVYNNFTLATN